MLDDQEDAEVIAIASTLNPYAAQEWKQGSPSDRGLGMGTLGEEGKWRNAKMHARRIVELLAERGWARPTTPGL